MITVIRRRIKSTGFKVSVWAFLLIVLFFWTVPDSIRRSTGESSWVATINGEDVPYNEFSRRVREYSRQMGLAANPSMVSSYAFAMIAQEQLVDQVLRQLKVALHSDSIVDRMNNIAFVQRELSDLVPLGAFDTFGNIDVPLFHSYLRQAGISEADFDRMLEQRLQRRLVMNLVSGASYVPDFELKEQYSLNYLGRKFSVITLPLSSFVKKEKEVKITQEMLQEFFDQENETAKRYWVAEKRSGQMWTFDPGKYGIAVSDEEVETYYDKNKAKKFLEEPAQVQVRLIRFNVESDADKQSVLGKAQRVQAELLKDPVSFASVAKELSDDKATAEQGGLLPYFAKGEKEESFTRAAFLLKEDGDISDIVHTSAGIEILQRVSKKKSVYKSLASVKEEAASLLSREEFSRRFVTDIRELFKNENLKPSELETEVKKRGGTSMRLESMPNEGSSEMTRHLFRLNEGKTAFYIENGKGVTLTLNKVYESHLPVLDSIKEDVERDLYEQRATKKLEERLAKAKKDGAEKSFDSLKALAGAQVENTDWIKREDTDAIERLMAKNLPAQKMLQIEKEGVAIVYKNDSSGYFIRLDEIEPFDKDEFEMKKTEISNAINRENKQLLSNGFVASLYRNATIETNEKIINLGEEYSV